jgi:hypothetical protein
MNFHNYFDLTQTYSKNANFIFSFNFEAKDSQDIPTIEKEFNQLKTEFKEEKSFEIFFRNKGRNISLDFIPIKEELIELFKLISDLDIDLNEYHNFSFSLNSSFKLMDLFLFSDIKNFLYEIFNCVLSIKSSRNNIQYLMSACEKTLTEFHLEKTEIGTIINGIIAYLKMSNAISKIQIELKSQLLIDEIFSIAQKSDESFMEKMGIANQMFIKGLQEFKKKIKESTDDNEKMFFELIKFYDLDNINISFGIPKHKNGININICLLGLTDFVSNIIIYYFLLL